jgi:DNA-binding transcriptional ArsR family regulator
MHSAGVIEARIFQALADPSRRAIFESLTGGEAAVRALTVRFEISQPAISQHLAALNDLDLAEERGVLLDQLARRSEARTAFGRAISLANTPAEAMHIRQHLDRLSNA